MLTYYNPIIIDRSTGPKSHVKSIKEVNYALLPAIFTRSQLFCRKYPCVSQV